VSQRILDVALGCVLGIFAAYLLWAPVIAR
jgi:uncharacterized membrane protein YccC